MLKVGNDEDREIKGLVKGGQRKVCVSKPDKEEYTVQQWRISNQDINWGHSGQATPDVSSKIHAQISVQIEECVEDMAAWQVLSLPCHYIHTPQATPIP